MGFLRRRFRNRFRNFVTNTLSMTFTNTGDVARTVNVFGENDPSIQVTSSGSLARLKQAIASTPFSVSNFKVIASDASQMNNPIFITYEDFTGTQRRSVITPAANLSNYRNIPNQVDTLGTGMVVNVDTNMEFTLMAHSSVTIVMTIGGILDPLYSSAGISNPFYNAMQSMKKEPFVLKEVLNEDIY